MITGLHHFKLPSFPAANPSADAPFCCVKNLHQAIQNFVIQEETRLVIRLAFIVSAVVTVFFAGISSPASWLYLAIGSIALSRSQKARLRSLDELQRQQAQILPFVEQTRKDILRLQQRLAWMRQMQERIEEGERLLEKQVHTLQNELEVFERTCLVQIPS